MGVMTTQLTQQAKVGMVLTAPPFATFLQACLQGLLNLFVDFETTDSFMCAYSPF